MRKQVLNLGILFLSISLIWSCHHPDNDKPSNTPSPAAFDVLVEAMPNTNAPDLQSFVHGIDGDDWLLFAGRTNQKKDNGGLHDINGNYTNTSFPPPSYNDHLYAYNVVSDTKDSISLADFKAVLKQHFPKSAKAMEGFESVFRNSNPLVNQVGDFLYVVGGYGPEFFDPAKPKKKGASRNYNYITYNHLGRVNVPDIIKIIRGDYEGINKDYLMAFGKDSSETLISTGGELMVTGSDANGDLTFYMTGGHCFGNNCFAFQKYVDASYPFTIQLDTLNGKGDFHKIEISLAMAISDVSDPKGIAADNISAMRRRDGPIVPQIYKSPVTGKMQQGFAFYSGVFKAGQDSDLQAWNDAVHIHSSWSSSDNVLYTYDRAYDQKNYNVYAAPNFVIHDPSTEITNTYILGGIGDGQSASNGNLSGFTNTGMRIETQIVTDFKTGMTISSTNEVYSKNVYANSDKNNPPFYGAEAIFFLKNPAYKFEISNGKNKKGKENPPTITEIIDTSKLEEDSTVIGYVFGGIEAFEANPATYGPSKSRASNKVFKVTLKKK